jgi:hypothetical protein
MADDRQGMKFEGTPLEASPLHLKTILVPIDYAAAQNRAPPSSHDCHAADPPAGGPAASDMSPAHRPDVRPNPPLYDRLGNSNHPNPVAIWCSGLRTPVATAQLASVFSWFKGEAVSSVPEQYNVIANGGSPPPDPACAPRDVPTCETGRERSREAGHRHHAAFVSGGIHARVDICPERRLDDG